MKDSVVLVDVLQYRLGMKNAAKIAMRLVWIGAITFGIAILLILVVFWSALGRDFRVGLASEMLADALGYPVEINGDAYLGLRPNLAVVVSDLRLPTSGFDNVDLAVLEHARFAIAPIRTMGGGVALPQIEARGLTVSLFRDETNATTWRETPNPEPTDTGDVTTGNQVDWAAFLGQRDIDFKDMAVYVKNAITGFEFEFELVDFTVSADENLADKPATVHSTGRVNGEAFALSGVFPDGNPFSVNGNLGDLSFGLEGARPEDSPRGDFDGRISLQTPDLENLLRTLRLQGEIIGSGGGEALVKRRSGRIDLSEMDFEVIVNDGQIGRLTGWQSDLRWGPDFDLNLSFDFVGEKSPPPPAVFLRDIRPQSVEMRLVATDGNIEVERLRLDTNAFNEEFKEIGPFQVENVSRTSSGALKLEGLTFLVGPSEDPFLSARGTVEDLLKLEGYKITGDLDLPADKVFLTVRPEQAEELGRLVGVLEIEEREGRAMLRQLELRSDRSDLWAAEFSVEAGDIFEHDGTALTLSAGTDNAYALLDALQLDPVEKGELHYEVTVKRTGKKLDVESFITTNETSFANSGSVQIKGGGPYVRGLFASDKVKISDMRDAYLVLEQFLRLPKLNKEARSLQANGNIDGFQPLVLTESDENADVEEDLSEFQPLVVSSDPQRVTDGEDLSDFQPLVVDEDVRDIAISDLLDFKEFFKEIDLLIGVDVKTIEGQKGLTQLKSDLTLTNGQFGFGPVDLRFGSGAIRASASIDAIRTPDRVSLSGQASGADLGGVLSAAGVDIAASGALSGNFNLSGMYVSAEAFMQSMRGDVLVNMSRGRIGSALIDLAGLGVLPWLFSSERRQGYTEIVCIRAPLSVQNGQIQTDRAVMETTRVQLVGAGTVDLRRKAISFTAEPRPVGQPLARSAWPIQVSGALNKPDISVAKRKTRRATVPLAMPSERTPCVPDVAQLETLSDDRTHARPR